MYHSCMGMPAESEEPKSFAAIVTDANVNFVKKLRRKIVLLLDKRKTLDICSLNRSSATTTISKT